MWQKIKNVMFGVRAVSGFVTLSLLAIINLRWEFMNQKNFYTAFNIIYSYLKEPLGIYQKEQFYRMIFLDIYALTGDGLYDNDSIRKITSGQTLIHRRVAKKLYTENGYEIFRESIEKVCLSGEFEKTKMLSDLQRLLKESTVIPDNIKQQINKSFAETSSYQQSRAIAAILICSDKADCAWQKKSVFSLDVSFMRLEADYPPAKYPKYISDSPDAAVEELIGREEELKELYSEIVEKEQNMMISAVGGLGKTELVKAFLNRIMNTEVQENGIENVAWIPYNNQDIRLSIKQALHLSGDLGEVWSKIQDKAAQYNKKLLLIVDNIEKVKDDKYLQKLSSLPCRILLTSRQQTFPGFHRIMYLQPLKMDKCRELFYRHYQFEERDNETVNDIITLTAKLTIMIVFIAKAAYIEEILCEELNTGPVFGKEYEKAYLIPFSWSIADIMDSHWESEADTDFLTSLFHVCFSCSNYYLCEKIIDSVIRIQTDNSTFTASDLAYSYRNKIDLLHQFDKLDEAEPLFDIVEQLMATMELPDKEKNILSYQYAIHYQMRGDFDKSKEYFQYCVNCAENDDSETKAKDLSTAYSNIARMLVEAGEFFEAYEYIKKAIAAEVPDELDADQYVCYSTLASICTELMLAGYGTTFFEEAYNAFEKVIAFREKHLGKHHADTAVIYHDYSYFWYVCVQGSKAESS